MIYIYIYIYFELLPMDPSSFLGSVWGVIWGCDPSTFSGGVWILFGLGQTLEDHPSVW